MIFMLTELSTVVVDIYQYFRFYANYYAGRVDNYDNIKDDKKLQFYNKLSNFTFVVFTFVFFEVRLVRTIEWVWYYHGKFLEHWHLIPLVLFVMCKPPILAASAGRRHCNQSVDRGECLPWPEVLSALILDRDLEEVLAAYLRDTANLPDQADHVRVPVAPFGDGARDADPHPDSSLLDPSVRKPRAVDRDD